MFGSPEMNGSSANPFETKVVTIEPGLHRLTGQLWWNGLEYSEHAGDRDELGIEFLTEHSRCDFAASTCHCTATQRSVHVHAAIGHHFSASTHHGRDDQVAIARVHTLT